MAADEQDKMNGLRLAEMIQVQAKTQANAAVAAALERAGDAAARAEAKAREQIAQHQRRMHELVRLRYNKACADRRTGIDDPLAADDGADLQPAYRAPLRDAIALRAYGKAERRGFEPGGDTEDWLQAERELLVMQAGSRREQLTCAARTPPD